MSEFDKAISRWFYFGCLVEGGSGILALLLDWLFRLSLVTQITWRIVDLLWATLATVPLFILFFWMLRATVPWAQEIRFFLETSVRPILRSWSITQILCISALAGFGEELLFRGAIQEGIARFSGVWPALLTTSVLFGLAHTGTRGYAAVAALIGLYFGLINYATGNLLVVAMSHGFYDFVALYYFLRLYTPRAI